MGAKKIALLAPYMCSLTDLVVKYIENEGIEVLDAVSFEIADNLDVGRRDPALLVEDVKRLKTANADVVVLSACVQMQSLPSIQLAEDRIGIRSHPLQYVRHAECSIISISKRQFPRGRVAVGTLPFASGCIRPGPANNTQ